MSDTRSQIAAHVQRSGAASVARALGVSREAVLSYVADASREATRLIIEQRAERLGPVPETVRVLGVQRREGLVTGRRP
jgi:hypothetical protein